MPEKNIAIREITFSFDNVEENSRTLRGCAIAFRELSSEIWNWEKKAYYKERILPGALTETLQKDEQRCLWAHDSKYVLGRTKSKTLRLKEEIDGLYFEVDVIETSWGDDLIKSVKRGDIDKMSFGFYPLEYRFLDDEETIKQVGFPVIEIIKLELSEISLVSNPAYSQTSVRECMNCDCCKSDKNTQEKIKEEINNSYKQKARKREINILR